MPKNNSKKRKAWRRIRARQLHMDITPQERLLMAIFGQRFEGSDDSKPGTQFGK